MNNTAPDPEDLEITDDGTVQPVGDEPGAPSTVEADLIAANPEAYGGQPVEEEADLPDEEGDAGAPQDD